MANYSSGSIHFSGLNSDLDVDSLITDLYKIESKYAEKLISWRDDWKTRLEAFQQIRSQLLSMQSTLQSMNTVDKFLVKTANSSNSAVTAATVTGEAAEGVYTISVNQLATNSIWSLDTGLSSKTDVINDSGSAGEFTYTYKGTRRTVAVPNGTTLEGLKKLINNDSQNPGVKVQLVETAGGIVFQLRGNDTGQSATLTIDSVTNLGNLALETKNVWAASGANQLTGNTFYSSPTDVVNNTNTEKTFVFSVNGQETSVSLAAEGTLTDLQNAINATTATSGVTASLMSDVVNGETKYRLQLSTANTGDVLSVSGGSLGGYYGTNQVTGNIFYSSPTDVVNNTQTAKTFVFNVNGQNTSVSLAAGATLTDLQNAINATTATSGVTANLIPDVVDGQNVYRMELSTANAGDVLSVSGGSLAGYSGMIESTNWHVQKAQNAEMRVNGWPGTGWLEQESNSVTGVADGITFNLRSEGESVVSVEIDIKAIEENIEKFVKEVNMFRTLIQSLTMVDSEKSILDPEYAESQYEMQSGSVLTGNYGVQLLASTMKNLLGAQAVGFRYYEKLEDGTTKGDLFSSLSQLGITTDANQSSSSYGQLIINEIEGQHGSLTLTQALAMDPVGVAKLFAARSEAATDSADFGYNSHIEGITGAGAYKVEYTVDSQGDIASAWINGKEAVIDQATRQIGIYSTTLPANAADGLVLDVYNLTPGKTFEGTISIRNGKINELLALMDGAEGWLGEKGTLKNLETNYQKVIGNIEEKIQKEDDRLVRWERTMRAKFARLETVLSNYNSINASLESQIKQLNPSS